MDSVASWATPFRRWAVLAARLMRRDTPARDFVVVFDMMFLVLGCVLG
jgi:hypothetical protein